MDAVVQKLKQVEAADNEVHKDVFEEAKRAAHEAANKKAKRAAKAQSSKERKDELEKRSKPEIKDEDTIEAQVKKIETERELERERIATEKQKKKEADLLAISLAMGDINKQALKDERLIREELARVEKIRQEYEDKVIKMINSEKEEDAARAKEEAKRLSEQQEKDAAYIKHEMDKIEKEKREQIELLLANDKKRAVEEELIAADKAKKMLNCSIEHDIQQQKDAGFIKNEMEKIEKQKREQMELVLANDRKRAVEEQIIAADKNKRVLNLSLDIDIQQSAPKDKMNKTFDVITVEEDEETRNRREKERKLILEETKKKEEEAKKKREEEQAKEKKMIEEDMKRREEEEKRKREQREFEEKVIAEELKRAEAEKQELERKIIEKIKEDEEEEKRKKHEDDQIIAEELKKMDALKLELEKRALEHARIEKEAEDKKREEEDKILEAERCIVRKELETKRLAFENELAEEGRKIISAKRASSLRCDEERRRLRHEKKVRERSERMNRSMDPADVSYDMTTMSSMGGDMSLDYHNRSLSKPTDLDIIHEEIRKSEVRKQNASMNKSIEQAVIEADRVNQLKRKQIADKKEADENVKHSNENKAADLDVIQKELAKANEKKHQEADKKALEDAVLAHDSKVSKKAKEVSFKEKAEFIKDPLNGNNSEDDIDNNISVDDFSRQKADNKSNGDLIDGIKIPKKSNLVSSKKEDKQDEKTHSVNEKVIPENFSEKLHENQDKPSSPAREIIARKVLVDGIEVVNDGNTELDPANAPMQKFQIDNLESQIMSEQQIALESNRPELNDPHVDGKVSGGIDSSRAGAKFSDGDIIQMELQKLDEARSKVLSGKAMEEALLEADRKRQILNDSMIAEEDEKEHARQSKLDAELMADSKRILEESNRKIKEKQLMEEKILENDRVRQKLNESIISEEAFVAEHDREVKDAQMMADSIRIMEESNRKIKEKEMMVEKVLENDRQRQKLNESMISEEAFVMEKAHEVKDAQMLADSIRIMEESNRKIKEKEMLQQKVLENDRQRQKLNESFISEKSFVAENTPTKVMKVANPKDVAHDQELITHEVEMHNQKLMEAKRQKDLEEQILAKDKIQMEQDILQKDKIESQEKKLKALEQSKKDKDAILFATNSKAYEEQKMIVEKKIIEESIQLRELEMRHIREEKKLEDEKLAIERKISDTLMIQEELRKHSATDTKKEDDEKLIQMLLEADKRRGTDKPPPPPRKKAPRHPETPPRHPETPPRHHHHHKQALKSQSNRIVEIKDGEAITPEDPEQYVATCVLSVPFV